MKRRRRVMLVGRYGWPHLSHDSAGFLCQLAEGLSREQMHVEVVSPKHHANWPDEVEWKGIRFHRPTTLPKREWTMGRYGRALQHWLQTHGGGNDIMIALSMREEAAAVVEAANHLGIASVVRDDGFETHNDFFWAQQSKTSWKTWSIAGLADRIVTPMASHHRRLIANGCSPAKLVRISTGIPTTTTQDLGRQQARESLAAINLDLSAAPEDPVLVSIGRMRLDSSIHHFSRQIPWLVNRYPRAKIWLIGDGPARETIHRELKADGVRDCVAMPGSFSNLTDVLAASDVYVQMNAQGLDSLLPTVLGRAIPLVLAKTPESMEMLGAPPPSSSHFSSSGSLTTSPGNGPEQPTLINAIHWFEPDEHGKGFREVVRAVLDDLPAAHQKAEDAAKTGSRILPYQQVLREYVKLIHELTASSKREPPRSTPVYPTEDPRRATDVDQDPPHQAQPGFEQDRG